MKSCVCSSAPKWEKESICEVYALQDAFINLKLMKIKKTFAIVQIQGFS